MGLSLLRKQASHPESIIYQVCVNAMAYKFLTTVINLEDDPDLACELRANATEYRAAAQAALKEIPLLVPPSLGLLQAILCGVSLSSAIVQYFANCSLGISSSRIWRCRIKRRPD